jgi:hypothetical protein
MKDRYFAPGAVHASAPRADARPADIALKVVELHCTVCWLRGICLPWGLDGDALDRLDAAIHVRQRIKRKETLYRPGDRFTALYAIRLGTFKTLALAEDGCEQITGYHMPGDVIRRRRRRRAPYPRRRSRSRTRGLRAAVQPV